MKFTIIEGGNKNSILKKLNQFAEYHRVKTVAFAMWGKPLLYVGYEDQEELYNHQEELAEELPNEEEEDAEKM